MEIKYLGHASFIITSDEGIKIITDPYVTGGALSYGEIKESADIVTVSHDHADHNNAAAVQGNPQVVGGTAKVKEIEFKGIPCYHDDAGGRLRGKNTILCFEVDGIRVCHLGDLGHQLSEGQVAELGEIDILLIPVGGFYTIDAKLAGQLCDRLKPKVVIPMHYKTAKCAFPIAGVDEFLRGKKEVSRLDASQVEFKPGELPPSTQIIVLKPAL
ncbi:MAG: MBL fold metallo-hydrolase [Dehalococcoidia bacterium]|nr:MAG: MBL fold metallo-hydrolase [Dehalococcoidia bacterium]